MLITCGRSASPRCSAHHVDRPVGGLGRGHEHVDAGLEDEAGEERDRGVLVSVTPSLPTSWMWIPILLFRCRRLRVPGAVAGIDQLDRELLAWNAGRRAR